MIDFEKLRSNLTRCPVCYCHIIYDKFSTGQFWECDFHYRHFELVIPSSVEESYLRYNSIFFDAKVAAQKSLVETIISLGILYSDTELADKIKYKITNLLPFL